MNIYNKTWAKIREQFSEDEKTELRNAIRGSTICPAGIIIDETKLNVALEFKIIQAVKVAQS